VEKKIAGFETARHEEGRNQVNAKAKSCMGRQMPRQNMATDRESELP
jgi:hypothetical protein